MKKTFCLRSCFFTLHNLWFGFGYEKVSISFSFFDVAKIR